MNVMQQMLVQWSNAQGLTQINFQLLDRHIREDLQAATTSIGTALSAPATLSSPSGGAEGGACGTLRAGFFVWFPLFFLQQNRHGGIIQHLSRRSRDGYVVSRRWGDNEVAVLLHIDEHLRRNTQLRRTHQHARGRRKDGHKSEGCGANNAVLRDERRTLPYVKNESFSLCTRAPWQSSQHGGSETKPRGEEETLGSFAPT